MAFSASMMKRSTVAAKPSRGSVRVQASATRFVCFDDDK